MAHPGVRATMDPLVAEQMQSMFGATTAGGLGRDAIMTASFMPALGTVRDLGSRAITGSVRGTPLRQALATRWAPRAMAGTAGRLMVTGAPIFGGAMEGVGATLGALNDPRYMAGESGYASALGRQVGRMGQAANIKAHQSYGGGLRGLARGAVTTPFQGLMNPIATMTSLGQSLGRLTGLRSKHAAQQAAALEKSGSRSIRTGIAPEVREKWFPSTKRVDPQRRPSPLTTEHRSGPGPLDALLQRLTPCKVYAAQGKQASALAQALGAYSRAQFGEEVNDLGGLVKLARRHAQPVAVDAPAQPAPPPARFGDSLRALLLGMDRQKLQSLRAGAQDVASIYEAARQVLSQPRT